MRSLHPPLLVAALALVVIDPSPSAGAGAAGVVEGEIRVAKRGTRKATPSTVVVYLRDVPRPATAPKRKHAIKQRDVQFEPRLSVVVKGTTVDFPNEDKIFHNVFSASRAARFDLGLYRSGSSKSVELKREGVIDVFCNIHPEMVSRVLVVPNEHYAMTDAKGRFRIDGVPPGVYPIVASPVYGDPVTGSVTVEKGKVARISLDVIEGESPTQHRRKDGTPYGRYE